MLCATAGESSMKLPAIQATSLIKRLRFVQIPILRPREEPSRKDTARLNFMSTVVT
jgi:hypothetical protein